MAAKELADQIQEPLEDIGALSSCIMATGTIGKATSLGLKLRKNRLSTAERGEVSVFGRGQLLFIVRQTDTKASSRLQAAGHRFAAIPNILEPLARSMEVTCDELLPRLECLRNSSTGDKLHRPGVHLACFALRPVFHKGFDVLVRQDATNILPSSTLSDSRLEQYQIDFLMRMDNLTVSTCCDLLREKRMVEDQGEHDFANALLESIQLLILNLENSPFFLDARLVARPLTVPCSRSTDGVPQDAYIVAFRGMMDTHQNTPPSTILAFTPLKLFICRQHAYQHSRENALFAKQIHQELGDLLKHSGAPQTPSHYRTHSSTGSSNVALTPSPSTFKKKGWPSRVHLKGICTRNDFSSERNLVPHCNMIHVSNEVNVEFSEGERGSQSSDIQMQTMGIPQTLGISNEVTAGDIEPETFADALVAITVNDRKKSGLGRL